MMTFSLTCILGLFVATEGNNDSQGFSQAVDDRLSAIYSESQISPNPIVDDLAFVRRVYLDLIGRIPNLSEIESFQRDPDRNLLIDSLIESEGFDRFLSEAWTTWLIGYSNAFQTDRETFRIWLQDQLAKDQNFKDIVVRILTAEGSVAINGPTNFMARHFDEPLTAVCRSFLGVRLECAKCHDHPFDRWTQNDYEAMQRFFEPMRRRQKNGVVEIFDENRVQNLSDEERPRFLTGSRTRTGRYRKELALYLTNCKPFARNFANRCWYFLIGKGIVDPADDFNQENLPVDRELLEMLAQSARDSDFNIKEMFRVVCKTKAYQRQIAKSDQSPQLLDTFAAKTIKPLLPSQYLDSLEVALERQFDASMRRTLQQRLTESGDLNEDYQRIWEYRESVQQLMSNMTLEFREKNW